MEHLGGKPELSPRRSQLSQGVLAAHVPPTQSRFGALPLHASWRSWVSGLVDPILKPIADSLHASPSQASLLFTSYVAVTSVGWSPES